ncbi:MAG: TIGR03560 family F420-dependent LLM class oxidoreductase [Candidatus Heimdallarchaeota archaeon]|nr:TIGR03560 family F420-dependent LLM class oxidoreductase [Candidatus Heimdallarchaeota archaeon]
MKIGLQVPNFTFPGGKDSFAQDIKEIVSQVDNAGFYSLWVMDHFFQIGSEKSNLLGPAEEDMYEGYSVLNYIAALTKNVKLGTMVTGNIYHHPGMLMKTVTTLDILSNGRAYFGIGAGWFERESIGLGIPFYDWTIRFEMLEETLQIARLMWSEKNGEEYKGKHYHLEETMCHPQPIQKYPPIMIGGMGPKKTLKLVAKYADAANLFFGRGLDKVENAIKILKKHCETENRPYDEIEKTALSPVFLDQPNASEINDYGGKSLKTADDINATLKILADMGVDHVIFNMRYPLAKQEPIQIFKEEIIPVVADY